MGRAPAARPPYLPLIPTETEGEVAPPLPFPPNFSFPFLSLPPEARRKIYRMLFRSSVPLYPAIDTSPQNDVPNNCKIFPRPSFPVSFLLTNRQINQEASAVLWGDNQIVLQFPINWNHERSHATEEGRGPRIPPWFVRRHTFIPPVNHLRQIRNLVIEAYLFRSPYVGSVADKPVQPARKIHEQLEKFVEVLGEEHHINTCEIRLCGEATPNNPNEIVVPLKKLRHYSQGGWQARGVGCCFKTYVFAQGRAFGVEYESLEELELLCRQSVDVDQQVLEPLTRLRGVQNLKAGGRITDDWAGYLKLCMEGKPGTSLDEDFAHGTDVQWVQPPKRRRGRRR
jgi:hypothetical protein